MRLARQHSEQFVAFCQCPHVKSKIYLGIRTCFALGKSPCMITGQAWVGKGKKLKKVESGKWKVNGVLLRTDGGMVDMEQGSASALRGYGVMKWQKAVRSGKE